MCGQAQAFFYGSFNVFILGPITLDCGYTKTYTQHHNWNHYQNVQLTLYITMGGRWAMDMGTHIKQQNKYANTH